jgi:hypothetical protein
VPDHDSSFLVAYMPLECGTKGGTTRESEALDVFQHFGDKPRDYRNGLGAAMPSEDQIEVLRRAVRYLLAIEAVRGKSKQLNLTDAQKDQLRERESTERAAAESALLKLYTEVWLPAVADGAVTIDPVAVGGRPLQQTLDEKKRALVHRRVTELLTTVQPKVFGTLVPGKIIDLFKLGGGDPPRLGIRTADVVTGFYSFLGFTRLTSDAVIAAAVAKGVEKGVFAYTVGVPALGDNGRFQVDRAKIAFGRPLPVDEVDIESGFLILPQALPPVASPAPAVATQQTGETAHTQTGTTGVATTTLPAGDGGGEDTTPAQRDVSLVFTADRNQLFTAWNALANLADLAGKVKITVTATLASGSDKTKLENGVLEPLRETKLIE